MEIYKLNASLNWDSYEDTHPWDLEYATFDISMRCYPTHNLQIPINFIQLDKKIGYSIGSEYHYDIYNITKDGNNTNIYYQDDDIEEMQREQEEEYNQYTSFYNTFNSNIGNENYTNRETFKYKIKLKNSNINYFKNYFKNLFKYLDMKYIYGIFKLHLHKPYNEKSKLYLILINYIGFIFGKYKLSFNLGFQIKNLITKLMLRRKFYIPYLSRYLYLSLSVMNFHNFKKLIYGISTSIKGYSLQVRSNLLNDFNISLTKRGLLWTPFSENSQQVFLQKWKEYYDQQEVFSKVELPPPPILDNELLPELRILNNSNENNIQFITTRLNRIIHLINKCRNILVQISKILRYFIDLQVATAEHSVGGLFQSFGKFYNTLFYYMTSKFYEQLYLFSIGFRSRWSIEFDNSYYNDDNNIENSNDTTTLNTATPTNNESTDPNTNTNIKREQLIRIPIELDWGCEWIRLWCFIDIVIDLKTIQSLLSMNSEIKQVLKTLFSKSTVTICITLFDVYTVFSHTFNKTN